MTKTPTNRAEWEALFVKHFHDITGYQYSQHDAEAEAHQAFYDWYDLAPRDAVRVVFGELFLEADAYL